MSTFLERLNRLDAQERTVLTHLRYGGPATRQHLQERLGLSSSSMARITGTLVSEGFIEAVGEAASGGGRKAVLYGMGRNHGMLVGVELSRTEVRVRFTRPTLEPMDQFLFQLTNRDDPKKTVCRITEGIRKTLSRLEISPAEIPGVGLGTAGQVARDSGMLRDNAGYLHEAWQGVPLSRMMSEALGLPVFADNGANMAVLAERLAGGGKGMEPLAYVHLGMGVRTGVFSAGRLLRHVGEETDAFGHLTVDLHGRTCRCGNRGCMETVATLPALSTLLGCDIEDAASMPRMVTNALQSAEEAGHPGHEVVAQAAAAFGAGLAVLVRLLDLRLVILSGPVVRGSNHYFNTAVTAAQQFLKPLARAPVRFQKGGRFDEWGIATGAAAFVLDTLLKGEGSE